MFVWELEVEFVEHGLHEGGGEGMALHYGAHLGGAGLVLRRGMEYDFERERPGQIFQGQPMMSDQNAPTITHYDPMMIEAQQMLRLPPFTNRL